MTVSPTLARRWCSLLLVSIPTVLRAQEAVDLPGYHPINPMAQNRTGLYAPAPAAPGPGWRWNLGFDYASLIEYNIVTDRSYVDHSYLLDAELSRLDLSLGRDLSPRYFVEAGLSLTSTRAGFMDGFLNWFHDVLGLDIPERERRPHNSFAYFVELPDGSVPGRAAGTQLGDLRISLGRRHNPFLQTWLSTTLPTGTGGDGYARGVSSVSVITTVLAPLGSRGSFQGSLGAGYTAPHGDLHRYQRQLFSSLSGGFAYRFWGRQSVYAQLFYHSPYYEGTGYHALDRKEVSLRYGWMLRAGGRTWTIGMTEDLVPAGPAIDAVFEFGLRGR